MRPLALLRCCVSWEVTSERIFCEMYMCETLTCMQMDSELQYFNTGTTHLHQSIHAGDVWLRVFDSDVAKMKVGQLACHEVHL